MKNKLVMSLAGALALSSLSQAVLIDSFTFGVPQSVVVTDFNSNSHRILDPGIWGGYRQINISTRNWGTSSVDVVTGLASINFGETQFGGVSFQYSQGLSSDWSWMREWKISFESTSTPIAFGVFFQSFPTSRAARFERQIGARSTPFTETLTYADSLGGPPDLTEMTHMRFYFLTEPAQAGSQIKLRSFQVVPEPSTGLAALVGLVILSRMRRR